jgi:hypothetical protein
VRERTGSIGQRVNGEVSGPQGDASVGIEASFRYSAVCDICELFIINTEILPPPPTNRLGPLCQQSERAKLRATYQDQNCVRTAASKWGPQMRCISYWCWWGSTFGCCILPSQKDRAKKSNHKVFLALRLGQHSSRSSGILC